jgi:hypothetical protein
VGQKSEAFWTRVLEKYLLLTEKHLSDYGAELPVRNSASLQQRWKKKIAYQMQLWNKFYRRIKSVKRSGWNEDNYVEEASKLYQEEVGKTFGLEKCVDVLHKLPKFDPMVSGTEESSTPVVAGSDDTSDEDNYFDTKTDEDDAMSKRTSRSSTGSNKKRRVNNSEPAQGSKISRPIGMKKAKKLAKLEAEERSRNFPLATAGAVEASNGIATIAKELVAVFKTNATMKQQDIDSRRDKKWMKMAAMYFKIGQKEKGMALLARIEEAEEGRHTSATIESSTIPGDIIAIQNGAPPDDSLTMGNDSDEDTDGDE